MTDSFRKSPNQSGGPPLSFAQERLWFLNRLDIGRSTYTIPYTVRFTGELDRLALEAALDDILTRHQTLRTIFPAESGSPRQQILAPGIVRLQISSIFIQESNLAKVVEMYATESFDLTTDIPLRAYLLTINEHEHVLLLIFHHIAVDGWSLSKILTPELIAAYEARCIGTIPQFTPLSLEYADYAMAQRESVSGKGEARGRTASQEDYWLSVLENLPTQLNIPTDRPVSAKQTYSGRTHRFEIDQALHSELVALAKECQATVFMVFHACLAALLTRLGCGTDIPIGAPIAGRNHPSFESLIGVFINTLVLRTDTSGNPTLLDLIRRVRLIDFDAYANQDVPFERLVQRLNPIRSLTQNPLFQVMLAFQEFPSGRYRLPRAELNIEPVGTYTAQVDLTFRIGIRRRPDAAAADIAGEIEYSSDLFESETIAAIVRQLIRVLQAAVRNRNQRISEVDLLDHNERDLLLHKWSGLSNKQVPSEARLPRLFESQASRTPNSIALECEDRLLTYEAVNSSANRLAHLLIARRVGPGDIVALALPRSLEMIVSLIGISKTGAAYLLIDTEVPKQRIASMLEDAQPVIVLTDTGSYDRLPGQLPQICLDSSDTSRSLMECSPDNPDDKDLTGPFTAEHPANIVYTSGSTGRPKGCLIPHRSVPGFFTGVDYALFDEHQVFLHYSSLSFDLATFEIWPAIVRGGRCVVYSGTLLELSALRQLIANKGITVMSFTASFFNTIVEADPSILKPLRTIIVGGEVVSAEPVKRALDLLPNTRIVNGYGPSECSVYTCCHIISSNVGLTVPIGRPIGDRVVYIVDSHLSIVPIGVVGEICIAGPAVPYGYVGRPEITAERFVPNPYGSPGERMYRTGDLARWSHDGNLEYFGRTDEQVKIRGVRIELAEIEGNLLKQKGISQAAVTIWKNPRGDEHIVAYLVFTDSADRGTSRIRACLAEVLPNYMMPRVFIPLQSLPFTKSGKIDKRSLPDPSYAITAPVGIRTQDETLLCELFGEVLGVAEIGVEQSFFELGGHSLLAAHLISRIESIMDVNMPIKTLFDNPTVSMLAQALQQLRRTAFQLSSESTRENRTDPALI